MNILKVERYYDKYGIETTPYETTYLDLDTKEQVDDPVLDEYETELLCTEGYSSGQVMGIVDNWTKLYKLLDTKKQQIDFEMIDGVLLGGN